MRLVTLDHFLREVTRNRKRKRNKIRFITNKAKKHDRDRKTDKEDNGTNESV